jgi:hypothetical protein
MTVSVDRQSPAPGQENVSGKPVVFFSLGSDDPLQPVLLPTVDVYFGSDLVVDNGVVVEGWDVTITQNAQYGWDVAMKRDLPPESWVTIRVEVGLLSFDWRFLMADAWGPRAVDVLPAQFSDGAGVSPAISFTLLDDSPTRNTAMRVLEAAADDCIISGSFIQSDSITFTGREGRYIEVAGSPFNIVAVNGPNSCMLDSVPVPIEFGVDGEIFAGNDFYSPSANFTGSLGKKVRLTGSFGTVVREIVFVYGATDVLLAGDDLVTSTESSIPWQLSSEVSLYQDRGLDVYVDGEKVVFTGTDQAAANWSGTAVDNTTSIDVTVTRTGPALIAGDRVLVSVLAPNDDPELANISQISWYFDVGDTLAPTFTNFNPAPATRGLGLSDNLYFEIHETVAGVNAASLEVEVNGVTAITGGAGAGDFSGSTVVANGIGFDVTIVKTTPWTDGVHAFVEVNVDDSSGNSTRRVFSAQFGTGAGSLAMDTGAGNLPANDVVRVVAFDLSESSFARPADLFHNGYAADGHFYANGYRVDDSPATGPAVANLASWFTEGASATRGSIAQFPVSGYVVVTSGYWTILDASAQMWMSCESFATATPGEWSMAGNVLAPLTDAAMGDDGVLFLAGESVVAVDFVADSADRYGLQGRALSTGNVSGRADEQSGNAQDGTYALLYSQYDRLSALAWQAGGERSRVFVACAQVFAEFVGELGPLWVADTGRDAEGLVPKVDVNRTASSWTGARMSRDRTAAALAYNVAGLATVNTLDWFEVLRGGGSISIYDQVSTPALPAEEARGLDMVRDAGQWVVALATTAGVSLLEAVDGTLVTRSDIDLTLNIGGTNPRLTAVALEPGFQWGLGHLYAAAREDTPSGKVVRWREQSPTASAAGQVTTISTDEVDSLSAIGNSRLAAGTAIRASMNIASEDTLAIRASLDVAA